MVDNWEAATANWAKEVTDQGRRAFKSLDLNVRRFEEAIDDERRKCPYFGRLREIWLSGFDGEAQSSMGGLNSQRQYIDEALSDWLES